MTFVSRLNLLKATDLNATFNPKEVPAKENDNVLFTSETDSVDEENPVQISLKPSEGFDKKIPEKNRLLCTPERTAALIDDLRTDNTGMISLDDIFNKLGTNDIADIFQVPQDGKESFKGIDMKMFKALGGNSRTGLINSATLANFITRFIDKNQDGIITKQELEDFKNSDQYRNA